MVPCLQNGPCVLLCSVLLEQGLECVWAFGGIFVTATALKGHLPLAFSKVGICLSAFPATVPLSLSVGTSEAAEGQGGFRARPGAQPAYGVEQEGSRERGLSQDSLMAGCPEPEGAHAWKQQRFLSAGIPPTRGPKPFSPLLLPSPWLAYPYGHFPSFKHTGSASPARLRVCACSYACVRRMVISG